MDVLARVASERAVVVSDWPALERYFESHAALLVRPQELASSLKKNGVPPLVPERDVSLSAP